MHRSPSSRTAIDFRGARLQTCRVDVPWEEETLKLLLSYLRSSAFIGGHFHVLAKMKLAGRVGR
jgi:hypothetical protein